MTKQAIIDNLQVDEEGLKDVKTLNINELMKLGIIDPSAFVQGVLDAENDNDIESTEVDYVKGYKYGKTGAF